LFSTDGLIENLSKQNSNIVYYEDTYGSIVAKICSKCKELKSCDVFGNQKDGLGGRKSYCRECDAVNKRKRDAIKRINNGASKRNRLELEERGGVLGKQCGGCSEWKPLDGFYKGTALGDRKSMCKECASNAGKKWRKTNRGYDVMYHAKNKERHAEACKNWRQKNKDKRALYDQRREARMVNLPDTLTEEEYEYTLEYFSNACALTGTPIDSGDVHCDHFIPLATGHGGTVFGNMVPLRADINVSKSDANAFEFFSTNMQRFNITQESFDRLAKYLADVNGMTVVEYRAYVYECHENPRNIE
jgi:hypothetical protein